MKIVSIDVGITNLAICVMSTPRKDSPESATIHYWSVIDLMATPESEPPTCVSELRSKKKVCGKKATFLYKSQGYCKIHEPEKGVESKDKKLVSTKKKKVKTLGKQEICEKMIEKFDGIREEAGLFDVDYVLIELQPGKNQRMKAFSEMIFTYFILRNKDQDVCRIKQVRFINAKNKLTVYTGPAIPCKLKGAYARRKYLGVQHCRYFTKDTDFSEFFEKSSKKDDLSDCYLQGLYFLKTKSAA